MSRIFDEWLALTSLEVSNFNTDSRFAYNVSSFLSKCIKNLIIKNNNTEEVTNVLNLFQNCKLVNALDVSNFIIQLVNVINISSLFVNCINLK